MVLGFGGSKAEQMAAEALADPVSFRVRHGSENLLLADVMFGTYMMAPMFGTFMITIFLAIAGVPLTFLVVFVIIGIVGGYVALFAKYTQVKFEAGEFPVFVTLFYELPGKRWSNFCCPAEAPFEIGVKRAKAFLTAFLPAKGQINPTTNGGTTQSKVEIMRRYHIYVMIWRVPSHVIPWCIWLTPAPLTGMVTKESGEIETGTFAFTSSTILYKNFFVRVPQATNAVAVRKWDFLYKGQLVPIYEIIGSDYAAWQCQKGILIPPLAPEVAIEAVNLYGISRAISSDLRAESESAHVKALLEGGETLQEKVDSEVDRVLDARERSRQETSKKRPPQAKYVWPILFIIGVISVAIGLGWLFGVIK